MKIKPNPRFFAYPNLLLSWVDELGMQTTLEQALVINNPSPFAVSFHPPFSPVIPS